MHINIKIGKKVFLYHVSCDFKPAATVWRQGERLHSHACVARLVDYDRLARLIHIVVHAEVGSHTMQQHTVIRSHLRKLLILVTACDTKNKVVSMYLSFQQVFHKYFYKSLFYNAEAVLKS